jgi:hypothetical protein
MNTLTSTCDLIYSIRFFGFAFLRPFLSFYFYISPLAPLIHDSPSCHSLITRPESTWGQRRLDMGLRLMSNRARPIVNLFTI